MHVYILGERFVSELYVIGAFDSLEAAQGAAPSEQWVNQEPDEDGLVSRLGNDLDSGEGDISLCIYKRRINRPNLEHLNRARKEHGILSSKQRRAKQVVEGLGGYTLYFNEDKRFRLGAQLWHVAGRITWNSGKYPMLSNTISQMIYNSIGNLKRSEDK